MQANENISPADPVELSDQELEEELTIAVANEHSDERFNELLAERERRRCHQPA